MTLPFRPRVAGLLAAATILSGCGGNGGSGPGTGKTGTAPQPPPAADTYDYEADVAFQNGKDQCSFYPLRTLAQTYGTKPTPEAVAEAVAKSLGDTPTKRAAARRGCLEALEELAGK